MKIPCAFLFGLMVSIDSYAMNGEEGDQQQRSPSPCMRGSAYASATDLDWNNQVDQSPTGKVISNAERQQIVAERRQVRSNLARHSSTLAANTSYQRNESCLCSLSEKRRLQMQRMQDEGIVLNDALNAGGNFALVRTQIEKKKQILSESEAHLKALETNEMPEFSLSTPTQMAISKFRQGYDALNDVSKLNQSLEAGEGWSETMFLLNPLRYESISGHVHSARTSEINAAKSVGIPLRHRLHPTANLVRGEKIIQKTDEVIWDAFLVESHLRVDEFAAQKKRLEDELSNLRAQFALQRQEQQNGITAYSQSLHSSLSSSVSSDEEALP